MYIIWTRQINFYDSHHRIRYRTPEKPQTVMINFVVLQATENLITLLRWKWQLDI